MLSDYYVIYECKVFLIGYIILKYKYYQFHCYKFYPKAEILPLWFLTLLYTFDYRIGFILFLIASLLTRLFFSSRFQVPGLYCRTFSGLSKRRSFSSPQKLHLVLQVRSLLRFENIFHTIIVADGSVDELCPYQLPFYAFLNAI